MLLTVGPVFTTHPVNQEEVINNSFTVECRAEGFPTPSIQWYHNNTMITNNSNRYIVETTSMNSITSIVRVIMADFTDSGVYHCEANSSVFVDNVNSDKMNISVVGECVLVLCNSIIRTTYKLLILYFFHCCNKKLPQYCIHFIYRCPSCNIMLIRVCTNFFSTIFSL